MRVLNLTGMSKGQVSDMAKELDEVVAGFRPPAFESRPLYLLSVFGSTPSASAAWKAEGW